MFVLLLAVVTIPEFVLLQMAMPDGHFSSIHCPWCSNYAVDCVFVPYALRFQSSDFTSSDEYTVCIPNDTLTFSGHPVSQLVGPVTSFLTPGQDPPCTTTAEACFLCAALNVNVDGSFDSTCQRHTLHCILCGDFCFTHQPHDFCAQWLLVLRRSSKWSLDIQANP